MSTQCDPYLVLGVDRDVEAADLKRVFRSLARRYHPDLNPDDPAAEERFKEVQAAYAVLSDPVKRHLFDTGQLGFDARKVDVSELGLEEILGGLFSPATEGSKPRGFRELWRELRGGSPAPAEGVADASEQPSGLTVRVPTQALRDGGAVAVTLGGGRIQFDVPPGTTDGALLKLEDGTVVRVVSG